MKLAAGAMVTPRLELARPLADAPAGNVWVANHSTLGVQVAVKFHAAEADGRDETAEGAEPAPSPAATERFARQAFVASRLAGPHLVKVIEQGVAKGAVPFIASELLEGKSLRRRLSQRGPLSLLEAQDVLQQVAGVLSKAHGLGLAHGSLCPDHLLATESSGAPFIKILNYGDVSSASAAERTPERLAYLSPEQLELGKGCTQESDLWALSVTLYELLTKFLPFDGATPEELREAICTGELAPPSRYRSELPPALDQWFARALAKDPLSRFGSASELALGFAQALVTDPAPRLESSPRHERAAPLPFESAPPVPATDEIEEDSIEDETRVTSPVSEREPPRSAPPPSRRSAPPPPSARRDSVRPPPPSSVPLPRFGDVSGSDPALADLADAVMSEAVTHLATPAVTAVPAAVAAAPLPPGAGMPEIADEEDDDEELTQVRDLPPGWTPEGFVAASSGSVPPPAMGAVPAHPSSRPPPPPRASQPPPAMLRSTGAWPADARPSHALALTAKTGVASPTGVAARMPAPAMPAVAPKVVAAAHPVRAEWASAKTKILLSALLAALGLLTTWRFFKTSARARSASAEVVQAPSALAQAEAASSEDPSAQRASAQAARHAKLDEASLRVMRTEDLPPVPDEVPETAVARAAVAEAAPVLPEGVTPVQAQPVIIGPVPSGEAATAPAPRAVSNVPAPKPAPRATKASKPRSAPKASSKRPSNCSPPYYFDRNNIRRLKLECL